MTIHPLIGTAVRCTRGHLLLCLAACATAVAAASAPAAAHAQTVHGRVVAQTTGTPVHGVALELVDSADVVQRQATSDSAGSFRLRAPFPGTWTVRTTHVGYAPVQSQELRLALATEMEVEITLAAAAVVLDPVRVVAEHSLRSGRLGEFYDRADRNRRAGIGTIYTRNDIAEMPATELSQILNTVSMRRTCPMSFFINGIPAGAYEVGILNPDMVEGVELYTSRTAVPPEYASRVSCGAGLVWMRQDSGTGSFSWNRTWVGIVTAVAATVGLLLLLSR